MDHQKIQSMLQDALEKEIASSQIKLWESVKENLVMGKHQQGEKMNTTKPFRILRIGLALLIVILLMTFAFATPQGRAWAQEVARFFTRINSTTVELSDEEIKGINEIGESYDLPLVPVFIPTVSPETKEISGCETSQIAESYRCQVALAESSLEFDLKELPEKPKHWDFKSLSFNADWHMASISYEMDFSQTSYSNLVIRQGIGEFSSFGGSVWEAVPVDKIESVSVGGYKGEYVKGSFGLRPADTILTWSDDIGEQRLIWSDGPRWYLIEFWPNLNLAHTMDRDELIQLAESLITSPIDQPASLNSSRILSISDAEKISGFDLKAPTLLPMDINFSYARYSSNNQEVHLVYGANEELRIDESKGKSLSFKEPLSNWDRTCEVVSMNDLDAFYCSYVGNPRSFLWWHKDGLNYQMYYEQLSGGSVDRNRMVAIAGSMQDIDDFRKVNNRSYEQAAMYAQALEIEFKKLPETSKTWIFDSFWSDVYAQCIKLVYKAEIGQNTLFINQCRTDKRSDISVFPIWSIEPVKVRGSKGQYIAGDFVMNGDGKQIWDSSAPRKQLYWQEDGLWMQLSLYGDEALLADKEDLISYAENLK